MLEEIAQSADKGETTWKWTREVYLATRDVESVIAPGETFALADQGALEAVFGGGRRARPFPEREGEYWGAPEDDGAAVREVRRARRAGVRFLVFAWPAFWWLDYYAGLHRHLRSHYRRILENERVVVFDLR